MSFNVLFVHGTGVRGQDYEKASQTIKKKLEGKDKILSVKGCYWAGEHGTALLAFGKSISLCDANAELNSTDFESGLWDLLYQDPLTELYTLHLSVKKKAVGEPPGRILMEKVKNLDPTPELKQLLKQARIEKFFDKARNQIIHDPDYQNAVGSAREPLSKYYVATVHALVAQSVILASDDQVQRNLIWAPGTYSERKRFLGAQLRKQIVDSLLKDLDYQEERAITDDVKKLFEGMIKRYITNQYKPGLISFTVKASGTVGDILMYQARGQKIRDYIARDIRKLDGPVILLAHSLGGIACVDLLLLESDIHPKVSLLVTVGSQAPLLYEMNALVGMPYHSDANLPPTFPQWLNIYDKNDLLSYIGGKIFPDKVEDFCVESKKPFPDSHGAYWDNDLVWEKIEQTVKEIEIV